MNQPVVELIRPTKVRRPRKQWKALFIVGLLLLVGSSLTYGALRYEEVRKKVLISGGGNTSILKYSASKPETTNLQKPGDGRYNLLLLGIGGTTDAGVAHSGTLLTDSIQVISVDTVNKKVSLTSIPRDFYYTTNYGGGKINAVYALAEQDKPGSGGQAIRQAVGSILGVNISNFVVIDFTAAKEAVDEVGGIDVNVPKALYDPSYPCVDEVNFCPFSISAGLHHMNGDLALKYMRTRHADNDFGRSSRQQEVISALKTKALSAGVLTNPVTINNLLTIFSKHIHTDLQLSEIQSFISTYKDISSQNTTSHVLDTTSELGLLTSRTEPVTGYVEYPLGGDTAYAPIQQWFQKNNPDPFIGKEKAEVTVIKGEKASLAATNTFVQKLEEYGFTVHLNVPTASPQNTSQVTHINSTSSGQFPVTKNYLSSLLSTTVQVAPPVVQGSDFEIFYEGDQSKSVK